MNTTTIGLDIAKRVFQVHGTDSLGKSTMTRRLKRAEVLRVFCKSAALRRDQSRIHVREASLPHDFPTAFNGGAYCRC